MRLLYGRYFKARYQSIAALIPPGAEIIEVCSGDCRLYQKFLRKKEVDYLGLDYSPQFIKYAHQRGIKAAQFDVRTQSIPPADFLIMHASLYQFIPDEKMVLEKLLASSKKKVIIAEPIRNLSDSRLVLIAQASRHLTKTVPGQSRNTGKRFSSENLFNLFHAYNEFERCFRIPGGREMIGVFKGRLYQ
jgi:trans-aconitate methyltransferase